MKRSKLYRLPIGFGLVFTRSESARSVDLYRRCADECVSGWVCGVAWGHWPALRVCRRELAIGKLWLTW